MKHKKMMMQSVVGATLLLFIFAQGAHAYLDPGSGSLILQLILAGLFAALLSVKIFWGRIKAFFTHHFSRGLAEKEKSVDN